MKYLSSPRKSAVELLSLKLDDRNSYISILLYIAILLSLLYPFFLPKKAGAAVTESWVRFNRLSTGAGISGTACLETTTSGTETNPTIVFPAGWTISQTEADWTVSTSNLPTAADGTTATAWPNIDDADGTGGIVNGLSVTFGLSGDGDLDNGGEFYCFHFTGASSTIGSAGDNQTGSLKTQGGSPYVDSIDWATDIVASNADRITVTASVSAQFTFALSGNTASLGTLSSGSTAAASGINQTVTTNARNGWISWVKSETDGGGGAGTAGALQSTAAGNAQIDSPGTYNGTPETLTTTGGYVLDIDTGSGCNAACVANEYEGSDGDSGGHLDYGMFRQTANDTTPTAGDVVSLVVKARSSATTPAANDYTDTLTVVAAGSF